MLRPLRVTTVARPPLEARAIATRWPWVAVALFLLALALRLYRLNADPLWQDELYAVQLGRLGLGAIFANSLADPHPPLLYLLLWLGSGFATARGEWAYRWMAVLGGAATIPLVYALARRWAGRGAAALAALALAVSPEHLFYSQEARAYGVIIGLAALSAWVLVTNRLSAPRRWWLWAALSAVGLWLNYGYLMVVGVQALFVLAVARRQRGVRPALALAGVALLAIAPLAAITLAQSARLFSGEPLGLWTTAQSLAAGDLARYGAYWGNTWLAGVLVLLVGLGVGRLARQARDGWALYAPAQVLLPLAAFFLIVRPLLHINVELFQARQFLVLLPAAMVVAAAGLEQLRAALQPRVGRPAPTRLGWPLAVGGAALLAGLLFASYVGLSRYWEHSKSPEGLVARFVRDHGAPGTAVISMHIAMDAALSFYAPDAAAYFTKPYPQPHGLYFSDSLSVQMRAWPTMQWTHPATELGRYPRRWVGWQMGVNDALAAEVMAGCTPVAGATAEFPPFKVALVENCPP